MVGNVGRDFCRVASFTMEVVSGVCTYDTG